MKKFIFIPLFLLLLSNFSFASSEYTFIIHLEGADIEFKKRISGLSMPSPSDVYPKEFYTTQIGNKKLYVIKADPKRSDARGVFFALQHNNEIKGLDYIYDNFGDSVSDVILFDLDKDSIEEIITLWGDEESFRIRVDKFDLNLERLNIYNSARLGNPIFSGYKRKMLLTKNTLLLLYAYQYHGGLVSKKAMLTLDPDDPTGELYIIPLGKITKEDWLSLQK